jgi:hypothetical protein
MVKMKQVLNAGLLLVSQEYLRTVKMEIFGQNLIHQVVLLVATV